MTHSDREQIIRNIERLVGEKFYDPTFGGKDWPGIVESHRQLIMDAPDASRFENAVMLMFAEVGSSGLGLLGPQSTISPRNAINATFKKVDTAADGIRWVFQDVLPGGVASRAGVRAADTLISVNGSDIAPPEMPAFQMDRMIPIVASRNGERKELRLQLATPKPRYRDNPYAEPNSVTARLEKPTLGHLRVGLFPGKLGIDFAKKVDAAFSGDLAPADRLLIDLRGNPGGGVGGLRLMSYLTPEKRPIGYSLDRATAESGYRRENLPRFNRIPSSKLEVPLLALRFARKKSVVLETEGLGKRAFHGRVVLLVNEHSTGAAEMVTQFAKENRLAKIVGTKTPGRLVSRSAFAVGSGYQITIPIAAYLSWDGKQVEGKGIDPDMQVDWSYTEALAGVDNQLSAALEIARGM
ncbi:MAG: S41 family peptidase [Bryobacteraceae bacterium]